MELFSFAWFFDLFTDLFFIADLVLNFFTAFFDSKGMREFRMHKIRENYLGAAPCTHTPSRRIGVLYAHALSWMPLHRTAGWFVIDLVSCLPVGYITLVAEAISGDQAGSAGGGDAEGGSQFRALKALRLLRLAKMLRLAKVRFLIQLYQ